MSVQRNNERIGINAGHEICADDLGAVLAFRVRGARIDQYRRENVAPVVLHESIDKRLTNIRRAFVSNEAADEFLRFAKFLLAGGLQSQSADLAFFFWNFDVAEIPQAIVDVLFVLFVQWIVCLVYVRIKAAPKNVLCRLQKGATGRVTGTQLRGPRAGLRVSLVREKFDSNGTASVSIGVPRTRVRRVARVRVVFAARCYVDNLLRVSGGAALIFGGSRYAVDYILSSNVVNRLSLGYGAVTKLRQNISDRVLQQDAQL